MFKGWGTLANIFANLNSNEPSTRLNRVMRDFRVCWISSGKALKSIVQGKVQSFRSEEKRVLTCSDGFSESSLDKVAWIWITCVTRNSSVLC